MPADTHKKLRVYAAETEQTMTKVATEAIDDFLKKKETGATVSN